MACETLVYDVTCVGEAGGDGKASVGCVLLTHLCFGRLKRRWDARQGGRAGAEEGERLFQGSRSETGVCQPGEVSVQSPSPPQLFLSPEVWLLLVYSALSVVKSDRQFLGENSHGLSLKPLNSPS